MNDENKIIIECLNTFGRVPEQWELLKMIKELQSNWNSLREIIKDLGIDYLLDKMNELEKRDGE